MSAVRLVFSGVLLLALCLSCTSASAARPREILVGGYHFPPYLIKPEEREQGLVPDLVAQLNQLQGRFHFSIVPTSAARRYRDLEQGRYDLMLFEDPDWGWSGVHYESIDMRTSDAEVYVARRQPGRGQAFSMTWRASAWRSTTAITTVSPASTPTPNTSSNASPPR